MKFILRHTLESNPTVHHYFLNHGEEWPHRKGYRLIGEVTVKRDNARRFDTAEEAVAALKLSDDPPDWHVDEVSNALPAT